MNLARFQITGSTSGLTPSTARGHNAVNDETLTFQLETSDPLAYRTTYQVFDAAAPDAPLASMDAPTLVLDNGAGSTGQLVDAVTSGAGVTCAMPTTGAHSWKVRCLVDGGINPRTGQPDSDYVFERIVAIRTGTGARKIIGDESTEYSERGWADAQNEQVDGDYRRTITRGPEATTGAGPTITVLEAGGAQPSKFHTAVLIVFANDGTDRAAWRITTTFLADASGHPTNPASAVEPLPGWTGGAALWTASVSTAGNALVVTGGGGTAGTQWTVNAEITREA
jgi:hypothetical protein